ncbi:hypothetical protein EJB05_19180 [Eragrostis curvula]|uniref:Zeta toxin domain-containing protein n=1 Tax=Eragrostis curvula TaxID=38414 RepID=A0A5J9UV90_9POAL|nr:hypothetical protein EJB05_19180 [Eragrostis curvula]
MPPPPQCASKPPSPPPPPVEVGDMAEDAPPTPPPKLLYIAVADGGGRRAFRYTRSVLQSTLQLMGCKPRHAFKIDGQPFYQISKRVFNVMRSEVLAASESDRVTKEENCSTLAADTDPETLDASDSSMPFELYKNQTSVVVSREKFLSVVCDALSSYKYVGPNQKADFLLACRIKERKESVTILLCGTSGCGKSTLSSLLGSRLGITTVVSTDSIRHMMRGFADEKQNPLLYASTYHAGECLDPVAVAQAKAKSKANKLTVSKDAPSDESHHGSSELPPRTELIGNKQMAIEGYKAQSEMVIDSLDRLITSWEEQKESVIVEGVHLSLNFVEYRNQRAANTLGSKGMFQLIQRKGSSRNLMALLNTDGSVTKAWHVGTSDGNGKLSHTTSTEKAEAVNLQFGSFGISAWMSDTGGTSHAGSVAGSVEDLRADSVETGGRIFSSCCSSPKMSDSTSKELMEEYSVYGSEEEEEADDPHDAETDEDLTDEERDIDEIDAGSVDELSTKSDEEYDDLAMRDVMENGDWSDDEQMVGRTKDALAMESTPGTGTAEGGAMGSRYHHSLDLFLKMSKEVAAT